MPRKDMSKPASEFDEKIVQVNRVSKKTKGGNQIGFSVLIVVGDRRGRVGVALGKGPDVLSSIKKGVRKAKKRLITVPIDNGTIPFRIEAKHGAAKILLKPAPQGSGIIAGGAVRDVIDAAGIRDVVGKIMGSNNQANNAYATFKALNQLAAICRLKGLDFKKPSTPTPPRTVQTSSAPARPPRSPRRSAPAPVLPQSK